MAHGRGCTCIPEESHWADSNYYCPWRPFEYDLDSIPRSLDQCQVCSVLTGDHEGHMEWHAGRGDLNG